jgi:DUF4097 and DUF4098 domain-containing protein YvlB
MITQFRPIYLLVGLLPFLGSSGVLAGAGGSCGPTIWVEGPSETLQIDTANLRALEASTHNGMITFEDQPTGTSEGYVIVTKKGGGKTQAEAEEALEAIDVFVQAKGNGIQSIGWKWKGVKGPNWAALVALEIHAPGNLRFDGETHNGAMEIKGVAGDVRLVTHNGQVTVDSSDGKLRAETHNGGVTATYAGKDFKLTTHNGTVVADLSGCGVLDGTIETHNGSVKVVVGEDTSGSLRCDTHNGSIKCDVPLGSRKVSKGKLTGKIGSGEGSLDVTTHNGSIRISKTEG